MVEFSRVSNPLYLGVRNIYHLSPLQVSIQPGEKNRRVKTTRWEGMFCIRLSLVGLSLFPVYMYVHFLITARFLYSKAEFLFPIEYVPKL